MDAPVISSFVRLRRMSDPPQNPILLTIKALYLAVNLNIEAATGVHSQCEDEHPPLCGEGGELRP